MKNERQLTKIRCLILFLLFNGQLLLSQKTVKLIIPQIPQQTNDLCWAASMEMIMKYHNPRINVNQCRLAKNYNNIKGPVFVNVDKDADNAFSCNNICTAWSVRVENFSSKPVQFMDALFTHYGYHSNEDTARLSWEDVKREIDRCRPFIAIIKFVDAKADKHAVVVKGYEETANSEKFVWVFDPLRSCTGGTSTESCEEVSCEFKACIGCEYRIAFDLFTARQQKDWRVRGFVHNIYPNSDTICLSCDGVRNIVRTQPASERTIESNAIIDTGLTVTTRYINYDKMLTLTSLTLNNYLSDITTREILISTPEPQSRSQELINGRWQTVIIRNLKEIPKYKIALMGLSETIEVRLRNQTFIDEPNTVKFEYIQYTALLFSFYRFQYKNVLYLSPTANLRNPLTGEIVLKSGLAYPEKSIVPLLRNITQDFEKDASQKYDKDSVYTR